MSAPTWSSGARFVAHLVSQIVLYRHDRSKEVGDVEAAMVDTSEDFDRETMFALADQGGDSYLQHLRLGSPVADGVKVADGSVQEREGFGGVVVEQRTGHPGGRVVEGHRLVALFGPSSCQLVRSSDERFVLGHVDGVQQGAAIHGCQHNRVAGGLGYPDSLFGVDPRLAGAQEAVKDDLAVPALFRALSDRRGGLGAGGAGPASR